MQNRLRHLIIAATMLLVSLCLPFPAVTQALAQQGEVHHLVFASDYHNTAGSMQNAMQGMPSDVEYVSIIGDLVGGWPDRTPEYQSLDIMSLVQGIFPGLDNSNISLIWASHDMNVMDDGAGIVKCMGGRGSGPIYRGVNTDGSTAYYIYAVAFYEMVEGGAVSEKAAADFKTWVDGVDPVVPILVLCHVPMQCKRGDNLGALYWSEALNYAATGVEGIVSTDDTASITRNVIFLCGHNHSVSLDEFYFGAGGTMEVQIDTSVEDGPYSASALTSSGALVLTSQVVDEEYVQEDQELLELEDGESATNDGSNQEPFPFPPPHREAKGVTSNIYYTSLVAGYLRTSGSATLVTIDDTNVTLEKRNGGQTVALGVDGISGNEVESPVSIAQFTREYECKHASVSVSKTNEAGRTLSGATFALRRGEAFLGTYAGGDFTLSTEDDALAPFLPAAGETSAWVLQETEAPRGYVKSDTQYEVVVSASADERLDGRTYVNTTTYAMTIDGGQSLVVSNKKIPADAGGSSGSPGTSANKGNDSVRKQTTHSALPKTGDASDARAAAVASIGLLLLTAGLAVRRMGLAPR